MATFRATHIKIGTILESGKPHKSCVNVCRNVRTIGSSVSKQENKEKRTQPTQRRTRQKQHVHETTGNIIAVAQGVEQNAAQWMKLRDTVSGIRASVGNISLSWKNENGAVKGSDAQIVQREETVNKIKTEEKVALTETVVQNNTLKSETESSNDEKQPVCIKTEGESQLLELNPKWVEQILDIEDIQEEKHQILNELNKAANTNNKPGIPNTYTDTGSKEKLDVLLTEKNTKPVINKDPTSVTTGIASKISFSYFSKGNKSGNDKSKTVAQSAKQKDPAKSQKESKRGAKGVPTPSTMDRIRGAVSFSTPKTNTSNSAIENKVNEVTQNTTLVQDSERQLVESKSTNITEADKSYWNILSSLPQSMLFSLSLTGTTKTDVETQEQIARNVMHSELESESGLASRTVSLSDNVVHAESTTSKVSRVAELRLHLTQHPQFRHLAMKHKVLPILLEMRDSKNPTLVDKANETLAVIGYISPPRGRGIKMLSIDGGGTRGLIAIEVMQRLERLSGQPINQMFDFVIGSSTGALLASLIFLMKVPLAECKELYLDRSIKMFVKESLLKKTRNMALHDVSVFEQILKEAVGEDSLISTSRDPTNAKIAMTATLVNIPKWKTFMFRNYNHPPGVISDYQGSCNIKMWEAVRASGSAPIYYSPFQIGEHIFRDGGCLINNPTAAGIHECKVLWPHESFQCVFSIGNGRYDPNLDKEDKTKGYNVIPRSMKDLADGFIDSATDTEGVHHILKNTVDPSHYFRLSPYLRENYHLSEVQPEKIKCMLGEANAYMDRNELFMQKVSARLKLERLANQKLSDFTSRRRHTHDYILF